MADKSPPAAKTQSRAQNEAELSRLRKLRGGLPPDRKQAGAGMDRRMGELEDSLRPQPKAGSTRTSASRMVGIGLLLLLAVVIGFVGVLALGHLSGL